MYTHGIANRKTAAGTQTAYNSLLENISKQTKRIVGPVGQEKIEKLRRAARV
jgi:hypothetical protein